MPARLQPHVALLIFGIVAALLAGLSIVDMFVPRPFDGVILDPDSPMDLQVREVVAGSGAERAGIRPGHRILGIDHTILYSPTEAARRLQRHQIGDRVSYFVETDRGRRMVDVELGPRRIGDPEYLYACILGFAFFFVGLFVLLRQPRLRPAQVFFLLSTLFMLFLICRLRPASYSQADRLVLATGTAALLFLPATFLHFFLIFPRPVWQLRGAAVSSRLRAGLDVGFGLMYLTPPLVLLASLSLRQGERSLPLISGAPVANWWVLALYMVLGLGVLAVNARWLPKPRERRGALLVLVGSLFGLLPFLVLAVAFPALRHTEQFLFWGVIPLVLVPITFAYAIVRFQLLNIRVLLRKSLLYTATTAVVTGFYALGIALFNTLTRGSDLASSPYFPLVFALVIVLLFEPLRQRLQKPVDRFFFAERSRLQKAMAEMGEAITAEPDLHAVVRDLVDQLPRLLNLHFAALYLVRGGHLERAAGPASLPPRLPRVPRLQEALRRRGSIAPLAALAAPRRGEAGGGPETGHLVRRLAAAGVELVGELSSHRRWIGLLVLSGKSGQMAFESAEVDLLRGLLHQSSMALETSLLLEERTRQAELERELEIAAHIQTSLLPSRVSFGPGWQVAAICRPARHVGGDFITELPHPGGGRALAYGDVSGKSVSGALVMMAAYEILSSLALKARSAEELLDLANQRLYRLGNKRFVALGYFAPASDPAADNGGAGHLTYLLAGQPEPLKRDTAGEVRELPLPDHRLPLGALAEAGYRTLAVTLEPGEVILAYSDGVVEARSPTGDLFGSRRLHRVLTDGPGDPGQLIQRVLDAVDVFTDGHEPYDDLTLVAIRRQGEVIS